LEVLDDGRLVGRVFCVLTDSALKGLMPSESDSASLPNPGPEYWTDEAGRPAGRQAVKKRTGGEDGLCELRAWRRHSIPRTCVECLRENFVLAREICESWQRGSVADMISASIHLDCV